MSFEDRVRQYSQLVESVELNVLVWGPGQGGGEHYVKREQIRQKIQARFPYSEVRFSEKLDVSQLIQGASDLSLPERELWHLAASDICIVLDTSAGAAAEIAHFVASPFGRKLLILTHEQYKGSSSFPASVREIQNQLFYDDEEYTSCSLSERIMVRLRQVALGKLGRLVV